MIGFTLSEEQEAKANQFMEKQSSYCGAIGGQFEFRFCGTSVGMIVKVVDTKNGEELDLTEYDNW